MRYSRLLRYAIGALIISITAGLCLLSGHSSSTAVDLDDIELQVQKNVNNARRIARIPQLEWNEKLAKEARFHADNMIRKGFFSHQDPTRGNIDSRLDKSGIEWMRCGENLYLGRGIDNPAQKAVDAWLKSPAHRNTMLNSMFMETGVGVARKHDGTMFIVQVFI